MAKQKKDHSSFLVLTEDREHINAVLFPFNLSFDKMLNGQNKKTDFVITPDLVTGEASWPSTEGTIFKKIHPDALNDIKDIKVKQYATQDDKIVIREAVRADKTIFYQLEALGEKQITTVKSAVFSERKPLDVNFAIQATHANAALATLMRFVWGLPDIILDPKKDGHLLNKNGQAIPFVHVKKQKNNRQEKQLLPAQPSADLPVVNSVVAPQVSLNATREQPITPPQNVALNKVTSTYNPVISTEPKTKKDNTMTSAIKNKYDYLPERRILGRVGTMIDNKFAGSPEIIGENSAYILQRLIMLDLAGIEFANADGFDKQVLANSRLFDIKGLGFLQDIVPLLQKKGILTDLGDIKISKKLEVKEKDGNRKSFGRYLNDIASSKTINFSETLPVFSDEAKKSLESSPDTFERLNATYFNPNMSKELKFEAPAVIKSVQSVVEETPKVEVAAASDFTKEQLAQASVFNLVSYFIYTQKGKRFSTQDVQAFVKNNAQLEVGKTSLSSQVSVAMTTWSDENANLLDSNEQGYAVREPIAEKLEELVKAGNIKKLTFGKITSSNISETQGAIKTAVDKVSNGAASKVEEVVLPVTPVVLPSVPQGTSVSAVVLLVLAKSSVNMPQSQLIDQVGLVLSDLDQKQVGQGVARAIKDNAKLGVLSSVLPEGKKRGADYKLSDPKMADFINQAADEGNYDQIKPKTILKSINPSESNEAATPKKPKIVKAITPKVKVEKPTKAPETVELKTEKVIPFEKASMSALMLAVLARDAANGPHRSGEIQTSVRELIKDTRPDLTNDKIAQGINFALSAVIKQKVLLRSGEGKKGQLYRIANQNMIDFINAQVAQGNYGLLTPAEILKRANLPREQAKVATNKLKEQNIAPAVVTTPDNEVKKEIVTPVLSSTKATEPVIEIKKEIGLEQLANMPILYGVAFSEKETFERLQLTVASQSQPSDVDIESNHFSGETISSQYRIYPMHDNSGYHILGSHGLPSNAKAKEYSYMFKANEAEITTKSGLVVEENGYGVADELTTARMAHLKVTALMTLYQANLLPKEIKPTDLLHGSKLILMDDPVADHTAMGNLLRKKRTLS